ncbi:unnamed protein product [Ectocarpus sp. 8 AP-2014]
MLARANRHSAVLRTREEQFTRVSSLARSRAKDAKDLARDRILHPDKYKRVHRYMRGNDTRAPNNRGGLVPDGMVAFVESRSRSLFTMPVPPKPHNK